MKQHPYASANSTHHHSLSSYRPSNLNSSHNDYSTAEEGGKPRKEGSTRQTQKKESAPPRAYRIDAVPAEDDLAEDELLDDSDELSAAAESALEDALDIGGEEQDSDRLLQDLDLVGLTADRPSGLTFDPRAAWRATLDELALLLPPASFDTWIRDAQLIAHEDGEFLVGLPNAYARDWVQNRLRTSVKRTLSSIVGRSVQVTFRVCAEPVEDAPYLSEMPLYDTQPDVPTASDAKGRKASKEHGALQESVDRPLAAAKRKPAAASSSSGRQAKPYYSSQLNAHHSFASFVVGNHNRLAHAAAMAVADQPGHRFNPLFVYGGVGLGKTHLLHAIGNAAQERGVHTLYCSSEQFTNELISAIRSQSTEEFRNKYRQVDILLIDDIQFIGGKESTQEEFFHTFNHLQASGGQVVLSSDRPPKALATLEERLRSRFEGGLQTDISQPDFETRVAILQSKADRMGIAVSQDVLMLVAERVDSNIRELEGALNQLSMQAHLSKSALSPALALGILDNLAPSRTPCTPAMVIEIVADHYSLTMDDLTGRRRTSEIASARQMVMYLLREENCLSLPAIGALLGGRDHTTVRHGVAKIAKLLAVDDAVQQAVAQLREKVYMPFIG